MLLDIDLKNDIQFVKDLLISSVFDSEFELATNFSARESNSSFNQMCKIFKLTELEINTCLLCIGVELDPEFSQLIAKFDPSRAFVHFDLVKKIFHKNTLNEEFNTDPNHLLSQSMALLEERILLSEGDIAGIYFQPLKLSQDLLPYFVYPINISFSLPVLSPLLKEFCHQIKLNDTFQEDLSHHSNILFDQIQNRQENSVSLLKRSKDEKIRAYQLISLIASMKNTIAFRLDLALITTNNGDLSLFFKDLKREIKLRNIIFVFDCEFLLHTDGFDGAQSNLLTNAILYLLEELSENIILACDEKITLESTIINIIEIPSLSQIEQTKLWIDEFTKYEITYDSLKDKLLADLIQQFSLTETQIKTVGTELSAYVIGNSKLKENWLAAKLWSLCRKEKQNRLGGLANIIEPGIYNWEDLILEESQKAVLQMLLSQVQNRDKVFIDWGFSRGKSDYGLGTSLLLAGGSGTGKSFAAKIIASKLNLDIYQIDLSKVADKYIGETEKKLDALFNIAEKSSSILLFDEADSIFGKRSEVKDSKDRNANLGVSFLLQRMESYNGISILTTNFKSAIDSAFLRRINFIVDFSFPDQENRSKIWEHSFPDNAPLSHLDFNKLARLPVAGGSIRNISLQAAFFAASKNSPIKMEHLLVACRLEFAKAGKSIKLDLIKDWVEGDEYE